MNQGISPIPDGFGFHLDNAVFRHDVLHDGTGYSHDRARGESGLDTGVDNAVFVFVGGAETDHAFAPVGIKRAQNKVELSAGAEICLMPAVSEHT